MTLEKPTEKIQQFLDEEGRVKQLPSKARARFAVLYYLAEHFEADRCYTEKEVNLICDQWHNFGDYFLIRRELIDAGLLQRFTDGTQYWRTFQNSDLKQNL